VHLLQIRPTVHN